ncbi:MAG: ChaN family lipoprotein [Nitrospira sp.]|nr:ChaN family lipoprotein [Nitrospira sp.]
MKNNLTIKTGIASIPPLIKGGFSLVKTFFFFSFIVLLLQACFQTKIHADATKVFRVSDGKTITFGQMLDDLRKVNIILVGEVHNQEAHHRLQLAIIRALKEVKSPLAIGFEMFTADNQSMLDQWVAGKMSSDAFIKAYYTNWNFPWPLYRDIFLYLRENKIPAVGLNISPEITMKISASGFSSLTKEELAKLPPETGCAVDEKYMKFIRRAYAMHGHGGKQFLHFCEAQLIWDQVMARNLIGFLAKNPDKTLVALAGNGHVWKRGIPEQIKNQSEKIRYRVVLPYIPGYIEPGSITAEDADYILMQ